MKRPTLSAAHFYLGLKNVKGVVKGIDGIPVFYSEEEDCVSDIPFAFPPEMAGQELEAQLQTVTHKMIINASEDYKLVNTLERGEWDVMGSYEELQEVYEHKKINLVHDNLDTMLMYILLCSCCLAGAVFFFIKRNFFFGGILSVMLVISAILLYRVAKVLGCSKLYDGEGNWVDFNKRTTNLGGGTYIPTAEEATRF